ncbi:Cof-type HAD-IIB family hydrolase [[Mycoplasma] testudinis]|uniref:Cof-type HAD-IIB family hydrolase n=1 Tax=[Mycoplasma] testudinis TaxID=33924 RepID=UPI000480E767|nr:Cof-type HAD-IIB family hydrolase [[Mycoplasma] testudinis]
MEDKKIFVFDVDGTLLNDQKMLMPGTVKAVQALLQKGHHILLSSGRIPAATRYYYRRLNLVDYIIGGCGSAIYNITTKRYIKARPFSQSLVEEFIGYAKELHREILLTNGEDILRFYFGNDPIQDIDDPAFFRGRSESHIYDSFSKWEHLKNSFKVIQMSIKAESEVVAEWVEYLQNKHGNQVTIALGSKVNIDISPLGVSKSSALAVICKQLQISTDNLYVFGDSANDVSSFLLSGTAVAMGNAPESVQAMADVVIGDNNRESIYNYLRQEGLI